MSRSSERIRADLQARTGIDFARYADDELIDAVTGWSGLKGLLIDAGSALVAGVAVVVVALVATAADYPRQTVVGLVVGGVVAGFGVSAGVFAFRLRRRAPEEVGKVFDLARAMVDRVAADISRGDLVVSYTDAAKGIALVAAVPAITRVARRRFPLIGTIAAPAVGAVLTRVLTRVWPTGMGDAVTARVEGTSHRLEETLQAARERAVPKLATAMRWATLPLLAAGGTLTILGLAVALISVASA
jgi:hypothetical protein